MRSQAEDAFAPLVEVYGDGALEALELVLDQIPVSDLASLAYDWDFWGRPKQLPPPDGWRSVTWMTGRAFGKTRAAAELVVREVRAGRAGTEIGLCAGTDEDTYNLQVAGESGIIACTPPWWKAVWKDDKVVFPNGVVGHVLTALKPDHFRGHNFGIFWADEIATWPKQTWAACWSNLLLALRSGVCRLVNTLTPQKVPVVRMLLERAKKRPDKHLLVTGSTYENTALPVDFLADMVDEFGGTRLGLQELEGVFLEDVPGAIFRDATIREHRRPAPERFLRVVVSVDPAISTRKGTDQTGLIVLGLGADGMVYVLEDRSGKHPADAWAMLVFKLVAKWRPKAESILVLGETNRGGDLVEATLKAVRRSIGAPEVDFRGVHARRGKEARAEPVAAAYEKGRVSHAKGADLAELEEQMTTWDPTTSESPDRLDALVHGVWELLSLAHGAREQGEYESAVGSSRMVAPPREADDWDDDDDDGGGRWG